ncbi:hypothetical protein AAVH_06700 [Aphelenchoides avenae]|nr:hypothetical protein AAVH_06700 [Aphelenchus avenae]
MYSIESGMLTTLGSLKQCEQKAEGVKPLLVWHENYRQKPFDFAQEYKYMDTIATRAGSGKSSTWHNYTRIYVDFLEKYRSRPMRLLEIGIYKGSSVLLWEEYFPYADLHFLDITGEKIRYNSSRSHYYFFSQNDTEKLSEMARYAGPFDIVVDDGGHFMEDVILSFKTLLPHVRAGGMYVVEDLHTSYWTSHGGNGTLDDPKAGPGTAIDFLKNLVDDVNFVGAATGNASYANIPADIERRRSRLVRPKQ